MRVITIIRRNYWSALSSLFLIVIGSTIAFPHASRAIARLRGIPFGIHSLPTVRPSPMSTTIAVTTTADTVAADGDCSLREAITAANSNAAVNECAAGSGTDTITFNIGAGGLQTIVLTSALPNITAPLIIDGTTQPGFVATPLIEINGNGVGGTGLTFTNGNSAVRSLIINRFVGDGIEFRNVGNNTVTGCYIGVDSAGTTAQPNTGDGILVSNQPNNTFGGATAADRNIISGNGGNGILISGGSATGNQILRNYLGVNVSGNVAVPNAVAGVRIESAGNNIIDGNVISGNGTDGIDLINPNASGNTITGNFIGTDAAGNSSVGNGANGIGFINGAENNTIGGLTAATRNIISGNTLNGIMGTTSSNLQANAPPNIIEGNYIGTNASGLGALPNSQDGISMNNIPNTVIGGLSAGAGNVISGNTINGIQLNNQDSSASVVQGNLIGVDVTGSGALGNGGTGVNINNVSFVLIGGLDPAPPNTIAFNGGNGVVITGANSTDNSILRNSIFGNTLLAIDLEGDGPTPNDPGDPDNGANFEQNFPIITDGTPVITGMMSSKINRTYHLEFFSNPNAVPNGGGQTFLGFVTVTTDGSGNAPFFFTSPQITAGQFITATATDTRGNTSEFSPAFVTVGPTAVEFNDARAIHCNGGVAIQWQGGLEVQNLGYNVYRDDGRNKDGKRTLLTREPIAGSALITSENATDNHSYSWVDQNASSNSRYWIEDIDLSGKRTMHGPFTPTESSNIEIKRSRLLTELNADGGGRTVSQRGSPAAVAVTTDASAIADEIDNVAGARTRAVVSTKKLIPPRAAKPIVSAPSLEGQSAVKIYVNHDGWYRVTADQLAAAGLDGTVAPGHLQLFTGGIQVPMQVNADLSVEFYGQGLDTPTTDKRCYWLVVGNGKGLRINKTQSGQGTTASQTNFAYGIEQRYRTTYFSSLLNGEDENIFGPVISSSAVSEMLDVQDPTAASAATLEIALQGVSTGSHIVNVKLNGTVIGSVNFGGRDHAVANLAIPAGSLLEGNNNVSLSRKGAATDLSLLDYLKVTYQRQYRATDNSLSFSVDAGQSARLTGFTTDNVRLFDITNPQAVTQIAVTPEADSTGFALAVPCSSTARTMLALSDDAAYQPSSVVANNKSDWRGKGHSADLLVITHRDFLSAIDPLVQTRRAQGLKVEVANIDDVFDEFSFGQHTPQAIRDFLSWTKGHWRTVPRFVLLVGDATWDPRNYLGKGEADLVPTKLIDTSQLETASDDWLADFNDDGLPEMAIGRLPVRTADQAGAVVSKILAYDTSGVNLNGALLVADTGFEARSADVRTLLPTGMPVQMINRSDGLNDAAVHTSILAALNKQPLFVNYTGHGSVNEWTGAKLLTGEDASVLTNSSHLPVMMLMTCLNGYSHDVFVSSLSKTMLLQPGKGAVAVWSSSGSTTPDSQQQMARQLYQKLFGIGNLRLGEVILAAKAATPNPDVRRTWILLGDPTMVLANH